MADGPPDEAAAAFATEFARWRKERGLTKQQLARLMGFHPSYLSHVEGRRHRPTKDFARRAEAILRSGNAIWQTFLRYDALRRASAKNARLRTATVEQFSPGVAVVIEDETTTVTYQDGWYDCSVVQQLFNCGSRPVTRHIVQMDFDRYLDVSHRSAMGQEARADWEELQFQATLGTGHDDALRWEHLRNRDALDEIVILFEVADGDIRLPLYPDQRNTVRYSYRVRERNFGTWFQRDVRTPTWRLSVRLDFPMDQAPTVWGTQNSLSGKSALPEALRTTESPGRQEFEWQIENPMLLTQFRFHWRFQLPITGT